MSRPKIGTQTVAYTCVEANTWYKALPENDAVVGVKVQNQHAAAYFHVAPYPPERIEGALQIGPMSGIIEDILPDTGAVYVRSDTAGHVVTLHRKFVQ